MGRCKKIIYVKCEEKCCRKKSNHRSCCDCYCNCCEVNYCDNSRYSPCCPNTYNQSSSCNSCKPNNPSVGAVCATINTLVLTTTSSTPLTFSNINFPSNSSITMSGNTITFRDTGIYNISGNVTITNSAAGATNLAVTPTVLTGGAIINPSDTTFTGIGAGVTFNGNFNYVVQITVPNTQLILSVLSTNVPTTISGGQINITRTA